jgi:hypothetical protein
MVLALTLVFAGLSYAATEGPNNPGTDAPMASGNPPGTTQTWNTFGNTGASDDSYNQANNVRAESTVYLKATNFGFSLPSCSSIDGITVEIERYCESGANCTDNGVFLVNGSDAIVGIDHSVGGAWATADPDSYVTYGGAADTWSAGSVCRFEFRCVY